MQWRKGGSRVEVGVWLGGWCGDAGLGGGEGGQWSRISPGLLDSLPATVEESAREWIRAAIRVAHTTHTKTYWPLTSSIP